MSCKAPQLSYLATLCVGGKEKEEKRRERERLRASLSRLWEAGRSICASSRGITEGRECTE